MSLARFGIVIAYDLKGGIGANGSLPWHYSEDLQFFKKLTTGSVVIMGRKTYDSLPEKVKPLPNRQNIVISSTTKEIPGVDVVNSITAALSLCSNSGTNAYIIGGANLFDQTIAKYLYLCDKIYATEISKEYPECDTFLDLSFRNKCSVVNDDSISQSIDDAAEYNRILYVPKKECCKHGEEEYLDSLTQILEKGLDRGDRTGVGTRSIFGLRMEFDISQTVPILTTKRVFWKKVVGELLWFISGSTSVEDLHKHNIKFWDANSSREFLDKRGLVDYEEGDLGPVYGFQWRHWGSEYTGHKADYTGKGKDQLAEVINLLKNDPFSRRIILSAWNAGDLDKMALPPCHLMAQFYVREQGSEKQRYLDCQLYQRSGDMFLGVPFNITCYSALVYMLCHITGYQPGRFIHVLGDAHIYLNHIDAVKKQLANTPRPFPTLHIKPSVANPTIDDFNLEDFSLENYDSCKYIPAPMAV